MPLLVPLLLAALLLGFPGHAAAEVEGGISQRLARERAGRVSNLRCSLSFELHPGMASVEGRILLRFDLQGPRLPLVRDFAGAPLGKISCNGALLGAGRVRIEGDHWIFPAALLRPGANTIEARFRSAVAASGTPLTVYRGTAPGEEFLYTLLVPSDAHRLFPCFDQPDLKARFRLELSLPEDWAAVSNTPLVGEARAEGSGLKRLRFAPTPPLSTYLFAFAAGPFQVLGGPGSLRLFVRPSKRAELDAATLFDLHARSLARLEEDFGIPFPFPKLDAVLVPGFPYGGMEHAGCIFYRESALIFDHAPTERERIRRSTLVYHEVAHQWFGDLVTMRWFDDLWLKEGFATFTAYHLLAALEPERRAWLRFQQFVEPAALRVDATLGTTPIYQELSNLDEAKSNYGPIVYNKAPAVLRALESDLGGEAFRRGLHAFLARHAWGNARWDDLVKALERASGRDLSAWSRRWILARGLPRVRARWTLDGEGRIASFSLRQESVLGDGGLWPLSMEVLAVFSGGAREIVPAEGSGAEIPVPELRGKPQPAWVLPNPRGKAYGLILLDGRSAEALLAAVGEEEDPLVRAAAFRALLETVRAGELDPACFAQTALELVRRERDPATHAGELRALVRVLEHYLPKARAAPLRAKASALLLGQLRARDLAGMELATFRELARFPGDDAVLGLCRGLLDGKESIPGLKLGPQDRFLAVAALFAAGAPDAASLLEALERTGGDVGRYAFQARAAQADPAAKARVFTSFLDPGGPPEQWVQESLSFFHWPGQEALTLPFLAPALEKVEWLKRRRKIFFMPAWIEAFVNGHGSREALGTVEGFLARHPDLDPDIRRKMLQSLDELRRAVRLKETW
ncbi:MAG: M1 family aminopeptidase [Planctomycetota bacterium]